MDLAERHGFSMRLSWWVGVAARNNNHTFDEDTPYWRIGEARGEGLSPFLSASRMKYSGLSFTWFTL